MDKPTIDECTLAAILEDYLNRIQPIQWQMKTSWAIAHMLAANFNIVPKEDDDVVTFPALIDLVKKYSEFKENLKKGS